MNHADMAKLLAYISSFDQRTVGKADVLAWHDVLGDLPYDDCRQAVRVHHMEEDDRIKPVHIRRRVAAIRKDRAKQVTQDELMAGVDYNDRGWLPTLKARLRRLADGATVAEAIAAVPFRPIGAITGGGSHE